MLFERIKKSLKSFFTESLFYSEEDVIFPKYRHLGMPLYFLEVIRKQTSVLQSIQNHSNRVSNKSRVLKFAMDSTTYSGRNGFETAHAHLNVKKPTFTDLNSEQLKWYLYWRRNALNGHFITTDIGYVYLFTFELINYTFHNRPSFNISMMIRLYNAYAHSFAQLKHDLSNWIADMFFELNENEEAGVWREIGNEKMTQSTQSALYSELVKANPNLNDVATLAWNKFNMHSKSLFFQQDQEDVINGIKFYLSKFMETLTLDSNRLADRWFVRRSYTRQINLFQGAVVFRNVQKMGRFVKLECSSLFQQDMTLLMQRTTHQLQTSRKKVGGEINRSAQPEEEGMRKSNISLSTVQKSGGVYEKDILLHNEAPQNDSSNRSDKSAHSFSQPTNKKSSLNLAVRLKTNEKLVDHDNDKNHKNSQKNRLSHIKPVLFRLFPGKRLPDKIDDVIDQFVTHGYETNKSLVMSYYNGDIDQFWRDIESLGFRRILPDDFHEKKDKIVDNDEEEFNDDFDLDDYLDSTEFKEKMSHPDQGLARYSSNGTLIDKWQKTDNAPPEKKAEQLNYIVEQNQRLVYKIASRYLSEIRNSCLDFNDLLSFGNEGLLRAIKKFDNSMGYQFSTYASWWIRQGITRGIADDSRLIRIPVHMHEKLLKVKHAEEQMENLTGFIDVDQLCRQLDITRNDYRQLKTISYKFDHMAHLDRRIGETGDTKLIDLIPQERIIFSQKDSADYLRTPEEKLQHHEMQLSIKNMLSFLTEREEKVIELRYGLNGDEPQTLERIGQQFGVTRERIRQIQDKALRKLRNTHINKELDNLRR